MGYSVYFMIFMIFAVVGGVVFMIYRQGKTRMPPPPPPDWQGPQPP